MLRKTLGDDLLQTEAPCPGRFVRFEEAGRKQRFEREVEADLPDRCRVQHPLLIEVSLDGHRRQLLPEGDSLDDQGKAADDPVPGVLVADTGHYRPHSHKTGSWQRKAACARQWPRPGRRPPRDCARKSLSGTPRRRSRSARGGGLPPPRRPAPPRLRTGRRGVGRNPRNPPCLSEFSLTITARCEKGWMSVEGLQVLFDRMGAEDVGESWAPRKRRARPAASAAAPTSRIPTAIVGLDRAPWVASIAALAGPTAMTRCDRGIVRQGQVVCGFRAETQVLGEEMNRPASPQHLVDLLPEEVQVASRNRFPGAGNRAAARC